MSGTDTTTTSTHGRVRTEQGAKAEGEVSHLPSRGDGRAYMVRAGGKEARGAALRFEQSPFEELRDTIRLDWHAMDADLAWSYPTPLPESQKIAGPVCFYPDKVDLYVDGINQA